MGASAATATAVGVATVGAGTSLALQGVGMVKANQAAKASAKLATQTADYNARVDEAEAKQIELDSAANTQAARREAAIYVSRQRAAYAASGILMEGSPLSVEVATAGRLEQQIQQERVNAMREAGRRRDAASVGRLYGAEQSSAIKRQNTVDMLRGGVGILSTVGQFYDSGVFTKGK